MTIIEQIKAEIERRICLYSSLSEDTVNPNRIDEDRQLLSFISTLESEKPIEGLEQETQVKRKKLMEVFGPMNGEQVLALKDFARHFAQWGAEHLKEIEL